MQMLVHMEQGLYVDTVEQANFVKPGLIDETLAPDMNALVKVNAMFYEFQSDGDEIFPTLFYLN